METLVLASQSPRRKELLSLAGIPFEADAPEVDESCTLSAGEAVKELSRRKAEAAALRHPGRFILAADTLVALDGHSLGKPASPEEARAMLSSLSGRTHEVFTGVTVISPAGDCFTEEDCTRVTFCEIPPEEIDAYIRSGEPMDKAGAYGLQGHAGLWSTRIEGSHTSVIGLPLYLARALLLKAGFPLAEKV